MNRSPHAPREGLPHTEREDYGRLQDSARSYSNEGGAWIRGGRSPGRWNSSTWKQKATGPYPGSTTRAQRYFRQSGLFSFAVGKWPASLYLLQSALETFF